MSIPTKEIVIESAMDSVTASTRSLSKAAMAMAMRSGPTKSSGNELEMDRMRSIRSRKPQWFVAVLIDDVHLHSLSLSLSVAISSRHLAVGPLTECLWTMSQDEAVEAVPSDLRPFGLGPVCGGGSVE